MKVSPALESSAWIPSDIPLTPDGVARLRKAYSWFAASIVLTFVGGWLGARVDGWLNLFQDWPGWIAAAAALYAIPIVAAAARTASAGYSWPAIAALLGNAFLSGILMAPFVRVANAFSASVVAQSSAVTAIVFAAVSGYILSRNRTLPVRRALLFGIATTAVATLLSALILGFHWLSFPLAIVAGAVGVLILMHAIADLLHRTPHTGPVDGALLLFAGTCNVAFSLTQIGLRAARRTDP